MTKEKEPQQPPVQQNLGPFAFYRQNGAKNNTGTLKPKKSNFSQKPVKRISGRGR